MTGTKRKGTYILFLRFDSKRQINVGALGVLSVDDGEYCYVGSAMNGLDERIGRHMSIDKKMHWHIDRLTVLTDGMEAFVPSELVPECVLSEMAEESGCLPVFKGFGCSDCKCGTHLFAVSETSKQKLLNTLRAVPFVKK